MDAPTSTAFPVMGRASPLTSTASSLLGSPPAVTRPSTRSETSFIAALVA